MPSLLVIVVVAQVIIYLVGTLGSATVNNALWELYNRLPTSTSKTAQEQVRFRREVLRLRRAMNSTSAQDEFAKWAKLRRQHDQVQAELEKVSASLTSFKSSFDSIVSLARWTATSGFRFLLQFWYTKEPIYWLPQGWLPYYVEWLLAFPKAPMGGVSIQVWWIACASMIQLLGEVVVSTYALLAGGDERTGEREAKKKNTARQKKEL